ncbi:Redox-sensitive transcriptional activator SoxR [compost metagenome]
MAQRLGIPLATIHAALQTLPVGRAPSVTDWQRLSEQWRQDLTRRIDKLMVLRDQLDGCIGCGCMSLQSCPLRNCNDQLSEHGPGPQLLEPGPEAAE